MMKRVPSWYLSVGADTALIVEDLFHRAMAHLPVSHADFAERLNVSPSTVTRWANGKTSPAPEVMLAALKSMEEDVKHLYTLVAQAMAAVLTAIPEEESDEPT